MNNLAQCIKSRAIFKWALGTYWIAKWLKMKCYPSLFLSQTETIVLIFFSLTYFRSWGLTGSWHVCRDSCWDSCCTTSRPLNTWKGNQDNNQLKANLGYLVWNLKLMSRWGQFYSQSAILRKRVKIIWFPCMDWYFILFLVSTGLICFVYQTCVETVFTLLRVVGPFGNDVFWIIACTKEICEECLSVNKLDPAPSYPTLSNIKWLTECEHGFQTKNLKKLRSDFPLSTNRDEFSLRKIISN